MIRPPLPKARSLSARNHVLRVALLSSFLPVASPIQAQDAPPAPPVPVSGNAISALAEKEMLWRANLVTEQAQRLEQADSLYSQRKTQAALQIYLEVFEALPDVPLAKSVRDHALEGCISAGIDRATELINGGDYVEATRLLDSIDSLDKGNRKVAKLRARMQDPDRYPPALTPEHVQKVNDVKKLLQLANSHREIGEYDKALKIFDDVLHIDAHNSAARRGMEQTEQERSRYFKAARDHQRSRMLSEVDKQWEKSVPPRSDISAMFGGGEQTSALFNHRNGREALTAKLRELKIQRLEFNGASLDEVVEFLRVRSRDLDPTKRGIDFVISVGENFHSQPITLNLTNVPVEEVLRYVGEIAGISYRVEEFAVRLLSRSDNAGYMISKTYVVPPDFISGSAVDPATDAGASSDPFSNNTTGAAPRLQIRRLGAKEFLESRGVTFPEGSSASYNPGTGKLIVRNNQQNIELIDTLVDQAINATPKQLVIEVRVLEVGQDNLKELGFDWLVGGGRVNADNLEIGGGVIGNGQNSNFLGTQNFPFRNGINPLGLNPITAGLRSSGDLGGNAIEGLIGTAASLTGRSPGVFSIAGVFTDPQFQTVIRALDQKKGIDLMAQPSVVTRSGQKASVTIVREFIYPTEFDPPQIPTNAGSSGGILPVTPTTPTAFTTRNVGAELEVEPVIADDGNIDLTLTPTITDFLGFVNYGSPIKSFGSSSDQEAVLTNNTIIQPIFTTRRIATSVKIWDGATVVLGGLLTDQTIMIDDKVPVIGNIPYLGRLFSSKVSQRKAKNIVFFVTVKVVDPAGNRVVRNQ